MSAGTDDSGRRAADAVARADAQGCFDHPLIVQAGAGTGKTSTLVARIVTWLVGPAWRRAEDALAMEKRNPDSIAARAMRGVVSITFTEAAAAEMARRVGEALDALEKGVALPVGLDEVTLRSAVEVSVSGTPEEGQDPDAVWRIRARSLLPAIDRLRASTIHSFCNRLIKEHPLEIGWHPGYSIDAQGLETTRILRAVMDEILQGELAEDPAFLALAESGVTPTDLEEILSSWMQEAVPAMALEEDCFRSARLRADLGSFAELVRPVLEIAALAFAGGKPGKVAVETVQALTETRDSLDELLALHDGALDVDALAAFCEGLRETWVPNRVERIVKKWGRGIFNKGETAVLADETGALEERAFGLSSSLDNWLKVDPYLLTNLRSVLSLLLAQTRRRCQQRGVASFEAMLIGARDLLVRHPEVCDRVRRDVDLLLVDEFQDTNALQCDLLRTLVLEGPEADRPAFFVVGDPKQSIYSWRQADLEAYDGFVKELEAAGGRRLSLCVNFRSSAAVLGEVSAAIEPVMQEEYGLQPAFEPLLPGPKAESGPPVEYWVSWLWGPEEEKHPSKAATDDVAALEAKAVAQAIANRQREGRKLKEIGLLVRTNAQAEAFLDAFRKAGIPFVVERDQNFFRKREIIEVTALTLAIIDPLDSLSLLSWLRSASVGVPDAALIPLWKEQLPRKMAALGGDDGAGDPALAEVLAAVERVSESVPQEVPGLDRIAGWHRSLGFAAQVLSRLRRSLREEPFDDFIEEMRSLSMLEATEAARYLGAFRVANIARFYRQLRAAYLEVEGDLHELARILRRQVAEGRDAAEAKPGIGIEDAVQVMTVHKAKGLEFETVFLPGLHRESKGRPGKPVEMERVDSSSGERWEWTALGVATPGYGEVRRRRLDKEAAERVRQLYVGMTRAKRELILLGNWPDTDRRADSEANKTALELLMQRGRGVPDLENFYVDVRESGSEQVDAMEARWCFPGLVPERADAVGARSSMLSWGPDHVARASEALAAYREQADARMRRPFQSVPSQLDHEREATEVGWRGGGAGSSQAAEIGTAIHALLEGFDFDLDPQEATGEARARIPGLLGESLPPSSCDEAIHGAEALWDAFASGPLFERFVRAGQGPHARELPVLLPGDPEGSGPVGCISGSIDLIYREDSGDIVIVDYKTDAVQGEDALGERAARYGNQGALYQRAVREAMQLEQDPRFELWFLRPGVIWPID